MLNRLKHTHLTVAVLISATSITAQNSIDNALALNTGNQTAINSHSIIVPAADVAPIAETNAVEIVTGYTTLQDITMKNYFNLAGSNVMPYMQIEDASNSFDPERIEMNTVQFSFNNRTVEYLVDGRIYAFEISNIDHYVNNTPNCLIKAKIELQGKPIKVNGEKISEISIYVDRNDHISFIEVGETEYYLRP